MKFISISNCVEVIRGFLVYVTFGEDFDTAAKKFLRWLEENFKFSGEKVWWRKSSETGYMFFIDMKKAVPIPYVKNNGGRNPVLETENKS